VRTWNFPFTADTEWSESWIPCSASESIFLYSSFLPNDYKINLHLELSHNEVSISLMALGIKLHLLREQLYWSTEGATWYLSGIVLIAFICNFRWSCLKKRCFIHTCILKIWIYTYVFSRKRKTVSFPLFWLPSIYTSYKRLGLYHIWGS
jgi:hypothetical protein